ncbi:MAG: IS4 family transposase [Phycisphaerales bacterium]|nr:MAG: IS4 family transposase [Phycisphaerales bacterium]
MDAWRGHRVVLVDGTCLTLPDEPELRKNFPPPKGNHGYGRYPLARMVCVSLARTMTVVNYRIGKYRQDENTLLTPMLKTLQKGDLLVADRHFAGANLYHNYRVNGLEYLTRVHQKLKISRLKRLYQHSENDFVAKLKIGNLYRRRDPELPKYVTARFIKVAASIRGKGRDMWLVTSLLDATEYPANEIAELYLQRWRIETLFRQFKVNFSSDQLRSKSVDAISKEVAARICAVNIVRTIMLEAAIESNVDPMRISFVTAVRTMIAYAPAMAMRPTHQLPLIYQSMLKEIASHIVPERPGRLEPRRLAHDPKHYPRLRITREQWRAQYAA